MSKRGLPINLDDLIHRRVIENERIEFKATWNQPVKDSVIRTACAFANDLLNTNGGYVVIGIEEKDGKPLLPPRGLENLNPDTIQKEVIGACKGTISPEYLPLIFREEFQCVEIMIIWCPAGENRPYQAPRKKGGDKLYWIRPSSLTMEAKGDLKRQLFEQAGKIPFDDRRSLKAEFDDISPALLTRFLEDIRSQIPKLGLPHKEVCDNMKLTVRLNGHKVPRNVALMFFNSDPEAFFRGCRIEVVRFPEDAGGDLIDEHIVVGPVHRQVEMCLKFLQGINGVLLKKRPDRAEVDRFYPYPLGAMEEAVVNAVFHRSYEYPPEPVKVYIYPDRMEITSYPGPLQGIKKEHLEKGSTPALPLRNRRIGEFLKDLRLAEARGTGLSKIIQKMKENGSPPPEFDFDEERTYFRVTLPIHQKYHDIKTQAGKKLVLDKDNGSYVIFTFGSVGAGKSTLMAAMAKRLFETYKIRTNAVSRAGNLALMNDWLGSLKNNEFPPRSRPGQIIEVDMGIELKEEVLKFTLLEMSGEDLKQLDPLEEKNKLHRQLLDYARRAEAFSVVVPYDEAEQYDLLVWSFFNLLSNQGIDMSATILIVSKWDLNTEGQNINTFVQREMPQTYQWFKTLSKDKPLIFPFSIGTVAEEEGIPKISELRLTDADTILQQLLQWFES